MEVIPGLVSFTDSPEEGDPACLCSLCMGVIPEHTEAAEWYDPEEPEPYVAVRMWNSHGQEWRFHDECFSQALKLELLVMHKPEPEVIQ